MAAAVARAGILYRCSIYFRLWFLVYYRLMREFSRAAGSRDATRLFLTRAFSIATLIAVYHAYYFSLSLPILMHARNASY